MYKMINEGMTEGHKIYNVRFVRNYGKIRIILYVLCKLVIPYIMIKVDEVIIKSGMNDRSSWLKSLLVKLFRIVELLYSLADYANFIAFLATNKFPSIWNRIFNLEYVRTCLNLGIH